MLTIIDPEDLARARTLRASRPAARRILVSKLDAIGDFVLFSASFSNLRQLVGDARITLLVQHRVAPLAELCPYIDEVLGIDLDKYSADTSYQRVTLRELRSHRFDAVINAMYSRTPDSDEIAARAGASLRVAFRCLDNDGRRELRALCENVYTHVIPTETEWQHESERFAALLRYLGSEVTAENLTPDLWLSKEQLDRRNAILSEMGIDPADKLLALVPGAGQTLRQWRGEKFAAAADALAEEFGFKTLLLGGKQDAEAGAAVARSMKGDYRNLIGKTSLAELASLISRASLYLGNDTGAMHIAAASGTPLAAIFGGGHPFRFHPRGENIALVYKEMDCYYCYWNCKYGDFRCIGDISVAQVVDAARKLARASAHTLHGSTVFVAEKPSPDNNTGDKRFEELMVEAEEILRPIHLTSHAKRLAAHAALRFRRAVRPVLGQRTMS